MQQCKFFLIKFVWLLLLFSCCCLLYCSIKEAIKRSVFHFSHEATFSFVGGITYYVRKTCQNQSSKTRSAFQGRQIFANLNSTKVRILLVLIQGRSNRGAGGGCSPPPPNNFLIIIIFSKSCRPLSILSFISFKRLHYPWQTAMNEDITHTFLQLIHYIGN
jgi:hypothetical protein